MPGATRRKLPAAIAIAACAGGVAACGKSGDTLQATTATQAAKPSSPTALPGAAGAGASDDHQIRAVVSRLGRAARARDGSSICHSLVTHALKLSIQRASHTSCSTAFVRSIGSPKTRYRTDSVVVNNANGVAKVTDQAGRVSHLVMQKTEGAWRIARIVR
jgi:hypothetical protein